MKRCLIILLLFFVTLGMVFQAGCKKSDVNDQLDLSLVEVKWILESIQYSAVNLIVIEKSFYILLRQDFSLEMEVDCNFCGGTYTLGNNNSISFNYFDMACTEAYCGDDSRDAAFHDALESATIYEINGNRLRIYFNNGSSQLNFIAEFTAEKK